MKKEIVRRHLGEKNWSKFLKGLYRRSDILSQKKGLENFVEFMYDLIKFLEESMCEFLIQTGMELTYVELKSDGTLHFAWQEFGYIGIQIVIAENRSTYYTILSNNYIVASGEFSGNGKGILGFYKRLLVMRSNALHDSMNEIHNRINVYSESMKYIIPIVSKE